MCALQYKVVRRGCRIYKLSISIPDQQRTILCCAASGTTPPTKADAAYDE
jgi:hypothetical protein